MSSHLHTHTYTALPIHPANPKPAPVSCQNTSPPPPPPTASHPTFLSHTAPSPPSRGQADGDLVGQPPPAHGGARWPLPPPRTSSGRTRSTYPACTRAVPARARRAGVIQLNSHGPSPSTGPAPRRSNKHREWAYPACMRMTCGAGPAARQSSWCINSRTSLGRLSEEARHELVVHRGARLLGAVAVEGGAPPEVLEGGVVGFAIRSASRWLLSLMTVVMTWRFTMTLPGRARHVLLLSLLARRNDLLVSERMTRRLGRGLATLIVDRGSLPASRSIGDAGKTKTEHGE
ncbi:hypothetical protein LX32DRAFT_292279 [Colletotrichum zoysiae]|uniref:Uncharacterized protein n=1 Tax=Colletotrichum zoysiae TaxID=1216348 RepID=A0AAD9HLB9_9PEZI|nr:hypothetical protein LX32DRAFT_292279 [Colletotrichum zoysiae]